MNELDQRLENLYAADARAWRIQSVGGVSRRPRWISAASFIAATAAASIAVILLVGVLLQGRTQVGSPGSLPTASPVATTPSLTPDRKAVTQNGQTVLAIDNPQIVQWFRTESQLCDANNIGRTADRRSFCTDVTAFRDKTRFASVIPSPDGMSLGFTITSDTRSPDAVAGFYARSSGKITFLTRYYLENEFISFSPSGTHFVYRDNCSHMKCALYIRDTATLTERLSVNAPIWLVDRAANATFVRWVSDSEIEYKLGNDVKRASF